MTDQPPTAQGLLPGRRLLLLVAAVAVAAGSLGVVFAVRNYIRAQDAARTELVSIATRSAARADAFLRDRGQALARRAIIAGASPSVASLRRASVDRGEVRDLTYLPVRRLGRALTVAGWRRATATERALAASVAISGQAALRVALTAAGPVLLVAAPPPTAGSPGGAYIAQVVLDGAPLLDRGEGMVLVGNGITVVPAPGGWAMASGSRPGGGDMLAVASPMATMPWQAVAARPAADVLAGARQEMAVRVVVWIGLAAVALGVAVVMATRLDRVSRGEHRARCRLEFLAGTASRLAVALSPAEVAEAALQDVGLSAGAALVVVADGRVDVLAWRGAAYPAWAGRLSTVIGGQLGAGHVMQDADVHGVRGPVSVIAFRLGSDSDGAILLWGRPPMEQRTVDDVTAATLASQTAEAMQRAVAQEREHDARRRAEVLADLNRVLQDGLTVESRAAAALGAMVPVVADFAMIEQVLEDGTVRVLASAHRDVLAADSVEHEHGPAAADAACVAARRRVLRERRPQVVSLPGRDSTLVLPVRGRAGLNAVLMLGTTGRDGRLLGPADEAFALALADAVGIALDNAQLFQEQQGIALRLQLSLLPGVLEPPPGLGLAVRFDAGSRGMEVGGDWYDVRPLDDGRWGVVVGDVVGRGIDAATVMGRLRFAFQALVGRVHEAGAALSALEAFAAAVPGSEMTTVAYAIIDTDTFTVHYACAGHPPPIVVSADGGWRILDGGREAPLNSPSPVRRSSASASLYPGDVLVMYTDGLVERRGRTIDDGIHDLARAVAAHVHDDADDIADHVLRGVGAWQDDDLVFLCVKVLPVAQRGTPEHTGSARGGVDAARRHGGRSGRGVVPGIGSTRAQRGVSGK